MRQEPSSVEFAVRNDGPGIGCGIRTAAGPPRSGNGVAVALGRGLGPRYLQVGIAMPNGGFVAGATAEVMEQKRISPRSPRAALEPERVPQPPRRSAGARH